MQRLKKKKILISVSYYAPHISGLTNSIKNLAEALAARGHQIQVLATQHDRKLPLEQEQNNVHVERVPYVLQLQKGFIMPFYMLPLIRNIQRNECVLINLPQVEGIFAAIIGRVLGKRVVSVYACEIKLPQSIFAPIIEQLLTASHFITLLLSHNIVALSDDYARHTRLLRTFKEKTVGIYPFIQKPSIVTVKKIKKNKQYRIGFLGRISAEKGLEYFLETIPLLKKELGENFELLLAGPKAVGEANYVRKIESMVEKYKDHVSFVPTLSDEEMGAFYASLDVLVLPSINSTEAFGMVQVEAMYCGTPVICTDLPGVRVPIRETGMGEIAKKRDSEDLAEKIIKVLKNRKEYADRKAVVKDVFSQDAVVSQYESLFA